MEKKGRPKPKIRRRWGLYKEKVEMHGQIRATQSVGTNKEIVEQGEKRKRTDREELEIIKNYKGIESVYSMSSGGWKPVLSNTMIKS